MSHFTDFSLPESILKALASQGFAQPTEIQTKAIPEALAGHDLMACAQTGSGKTAAFVLPALTRLLREPELQVLILAPTRELAAQIHDVVQKLSAHVNLRSALLIGGTSMMPQLRNLKKNPRVLIATPGRLRDHLKRGSLRLERARLVVLDECDRMLDMGFAPQIRDVLRQTPADRQTLLFSATFPDHILKLTREHLRQPKRVGASQPVARVPTKIVERVVHTSQPQKNARLLEELERRQGSVIIFARTKSRTDRLAIFLERSGIETRRIHGDRSQSQRQSALADFRKGSVRVLVATDIAARGLDVPHIAHVVNFDLPQAPEDYVHRIGRTARAGADGQALSFLTPEDRSQWKEIRRLLDRREGPASRAES